MKRLISIAVLFTAFAVYFTTNAFAGVMETVKTIIGAESFIIGVITVILLFVMKWIPNDKIQAFVGGGAYKLGVVMTLGLSKYSWSRPFWAGYVEPYFIDLFNNTIGTFIAKFIEGLRSDNG